LLGSWAVTVCCFLPDEYVAANCMLFPASWVCKQPNVRCSLPDEYVSSQLYMLGMSEPGAIGVSEGQKMYLPRELQSEQ